MPRGETESRLLIGGEQVRGEGAPLAVENPFTTETIVELRGASSELAMVVKDPLGVVGCIVPWN